MSYPNLICAICSLLLVFGDFASTMYLLDAGDLSEVKRNEKRKKLADLPKGISALKVKEILGGPDEIREIPQNGNLDGLRLEMRDPVTKQYSYESERWRYGVLEKHMFASIGFVGFDKDGRVVDAVPTDYFCQSGRILPHIVPATSNSAIKTSTGLSCTLGKIEEDTAKIGASQSLKTVVTIHNEGIDLYELKHPAALNARRFLIIEIFDAKKELIFRDDELRYSSFKHSGRQQVMSIAANDKITDDLCVWPSQGFGPLPAGVYYMRVYFPLVTTSAHQQVPYQPHNQDEQRNVSSDIKIINNDVADWEYYPSNLVQFEVNREIGGHP